MSKCIFFVDDNLFDMLPLVDKLRIEGYEVTTFTDISEALEELRGAVHVDLIITDLMMRSSPHQTTEEARMAGVEFCRIVRHELKFRTPIIVLTAVLNDDVQKEASRFGYVKTKPIEPRDLVKVVRKELQK